MILSMLNNMLSKKERKESPFTNVEATGFMDQIITEIENYGKICRGKNKTIRFNPKIVRIVMGVFLRSLLAYEDLKSSGIVVSLPSICTLNYFKKQCKVREGESIALYNRYASNNETEHTYGHLICD